MNKSSVGTHNSNNLDALRLLFASMVLLSHSIELVVGNRANEPLTILFGTISLGELGVDAFFILSGFLITKSFDRDPRPLAFLIKRVVRIFPAFIVASLISVLLVGALGSANAAEYFTSLNLKQLVYNALTLNVPRVPPTFVGLPSELVNGSMWTVRFEFIGYLAILGLGILGAFRTTVRTGCLFVASLFVYHFFTGKAEGYHLSGMVRFAPMLLSIAANCTSIQTAFVLASPLFLYLSA
jgi:peptidoglycan/LPS O-acetylase OafA/YrhL